jgi:hypothetical protein
MVIVAGKTVKIVGSPELNVTITPPCGAGEDSAIDTPED